jgi:hypothetical protein
MIGYSVIYIYKDITIKDIFWDKMIVNCNWEKAINMASKIANEKIEVCDNLFIISLIKATSQKECNDNGITIAFTIKDKQDGDIGDIYIVSVNICDKTT